MAVVARAMTDGCSTWAVFATVRACHDVERSQEMKRILIAYDGGDPSRRALDTGIELAKRFEASITVVSVVPMHPGRMPVNPWDDRAVHAQELQEARQLLAEHGITAELL